MGPTRRRPPGKPPANPSSRARRRRVAAEREGLAARVLVCEQDEHGRVHRQLKQLHYTLVECHSLESALRETARAPVDVAVVALEKVQDENVRMLQLLRRALPRTPIVLVFDDPTPAARLATLAVRPFYVAVPPVEMDEMAAVLRDALAAGRRHP